MLSVHTSPLATLGGKKAGGMNVYVRDCSLELGRLGIEVDVFTRRSREGVPDRVEMGECVRLYHVDAGPPVFLDGDAIFPYLAHFGEQVVAFSARQQTRYDVIFSHYWLSGWVAHDLRSAWGVPVCQMFHTLGHMKQRVVRGASERTANRRMLVETDVMSWADRLIAATPAERAQMLWLYRADRRRIRVIPPGVDLERFYPMPAHDARRRTGLPVDRPVLLFVGRVEPLKGIETLLQALQIIRQRSGAREQQPLVCVIGGDTEGEQPDRELERMKALSARLGLSDHVRFLGACDQSVVHDYYCAADALIMPSDYESFGMVALEAMACGTPVVASEVGGLAFIIQDGVNGFHVPAREPEALAGRIVWLLAHPEERLRIGRAAQKTAREHRWRVIADRLLAVFAEAAAPLKSTTLLS